MPKSQKSKTTFLDSVVNAFGSTLGKLGAVAVFGLVVAGGVSLANGIPFATALTLILGIVVALAFLYFVVGNLL